MVEVSRGDVVLCDLNPVIGTEQAGIRPAVVLQIDRANRVSPHTIIAPFTKDPAAAPAFPCVRSCRTGRVEAGLGTPLRANPGN